ncbi:hypothetical protein [Rhodococcus opacus]
MVRFACRVAYASATFRRTCNAGCADGPRVFTIGYSATCNARRDRSPLD